MPFADKEVKITVSESTMIQIPPHNVQVKVNDRCNHQINPCRTKYCLHAKIIACLQVHRTSTHSRTPHCHRYHHIQQRKRHKMADKPNEYQKETLRQALELEPEDQLKLQQLEREARRDPAMTAIYCILARQLCGKEEDAEYLHRELELQRKQSVGVKGGDEVDEEVEPDSAPSAPSPPSSPHPAIIATAPQTEQAAPNSSPPAPLAPSPRSLAPSPSSSPPPPKPSPPPPSSPKPSKGSKRHRESHNPRANKLHKPNPTRCINDWQCRKCHFWNWSFMIYCRNKPTNTAGTFCGTEKDYRAFRHAVQGKAPGVTQRKTPAKARGDWLCRCMRWNRQHWRSCGQCRGSAEGKIGEDWNPELREGTDPTSYPSGPGFWGGGSKGYSSSLQRRYENAKFLGVAGKRHYK